MSQRCAQWIRGQKFKGEGHNANWIWFCCALLLFHVTCICYAIFIYRLPDYWISFCYIMHVFVIWYHAILSCRWPWHWVATCSSWGPDGQTTTAAKQVSTVLMDRQTDDLDIELRLARLEDLMDRRPLLLNRLVLYWWTDKQMTLTLSCNLLVWTTTAAYQVSIASWSAKYCSARENIYV